MPAAKDNGAARGRAEESSPMKTEDCSGGARSKDECSHGTNEERCSGSGSGSCTPKDGAKNRECYCLLFGVELIPAPHEWAGSRAVPPTPGRIRFSGTTLVRTSQA